MSNEKGKIDWSSLWRKEDWWACWIGWFILLLAIIGWLPKTPKIATWTSLGQAFPDGIATLWSLVVLLIITGVLTVIGAAFMKRDVKRYIPGYIVIFVIAFIALVIAGQKGIKYYGFEYVLWGLFIGLFISNVLGVPGWLKAGIMTEYFIKIGLVCMGATIMFSVVIKAGAVGMVQALLVVAVVWFFTYWLCRRFGISERFSSIIASGNAICGVSAAIAAGGAVMGDPKEVSYIVAWLMICAVVLIIVMPPIAKWMNLPTNMTGAWLGGVIDNTGAVVAAGEVVRSKAALDAAAMVKMAQNILIGFAAFFLALWATLSLGKKETGEKPSFAEVWYRFPKFIVGFVVASLIISFFVEPSAGEKTTKAISGLCKDYRTWFFAFCFVCIGLETRLKDLVSVGGGKPAIAYWIAQLFNAIWTLIVVWVLWSGIFFTPPILPD
ncbi:MAG TPA: putative sulfate exporter family transporter [Desulfatiglandales bacterium]|nr:putative sulfate exporter family transporter [Desulfatiglandales bacterium]